MIKIVTDSAADLPKEMIEKYDITVVPLTVTIDGKEYAEGVDLSPEEFYKKMATSAELPKTSQPTPGVFKEAFSKAGPDEEVLCLTLSSNLSGTYQSAVLAQDLVKEKVTVFDTLGGTLAQGMQVLKAAEMAAEGNSVDEITSSLATFRENMKIVVLLETIENVVKGGRLSKFQGTLARFLDIKVILEAIDGKVEMAEKVRGKKKFHRRAIEMIRERREDFSDTIFGISHTGSNLEDVESLKQQLIEHFNPKAIIVNFMGSTIGTYAGKGGIVISF
ncbi:DegV family protein [Chungangia koreensis]|uniref:DegV family protein n=1 Tax=Chungangia koreensis TaxID=752657 RepID=A0ABV8X1X9_9LACT